jgi:hypothetical protein
LPTKKATGLSSKEAKTKLRSWDSSKLTHLKQLGEPLKDHDPEPVTLVIGVNVLEERVQVFYMAPARLGILRDYMDHDVTGRFIVVL